MLGRDEYLNAARATEESGSDDDGPSRPRASIAKLPGSESSEEHALEIMKRVEWFVEYN